MYVNVFLKKPIFTFIKHFARMIPIYYYSQSYEFNDPWKNDSPHFFFSFFLKNLINFFWQNAFMKFLTFFFENVFMNAWVFWKCIYDICLKYFFFFEKMNLWMHEIFFQYVYDVCLNEFFLWENACVIFVFFFRILFLNMDACIKEILFLRMHIWMKFLGMHIRCTKF